MAAPHSGTRLPVAPVPVAARLHQLLGAHKPLLHRWHVAVEQAHLQRQSTTNVNINSKLKFKTQVTQLAGDGRSDGAATPSGEAHRAVARCVSRHGSTRGRRRADLLCRHSEMPVKRARLTKVGAASGAVGANCACTLPQQPRRVTQYNTFISTLTLGHGSYPDTTTRRRRCNSSRANSTCPSSSAARPVIEEHNGCCAHPDVGHGGVDATAQCSCANANRYPRTNPTAQKSHIAQDFFPATLTSAVAASMKQP
jgi:hypothetical protein